MQRKENRGRKCFLRNMIKVSMDLLNIFEIVR